MVKPYNSVLTSSTLDEISSMVPFPRHHYLQLSLAPLFCHDVMLHEGELVILLLIKKRHRRIGVCSRATEKKSNMVGSKGQTECSRAANEGQAIVSINDFSLEHV